MAQASAFLTPIPIHSQPGLRFPRQDFNPAEGIWRQRRIRHGAKFLFIGQINPGCRFPMNIKAMPEISHWNGAKYPFFWVYSESAHRILREHWSIACVARSPKPFRMDQKDKPQQRARFRDSLPANEPWNLRRSGPTLQNTSDPGSAGSSKHQTVHMGPLVHHPLFINIPQLDLKTLQIVATGQAHSSRALTLKLRWFPSCCAVKPCWTSILWMRHK